MNIVAVELGIAMVNRVINFLDEHNINKDSKFIVAVSGGADSITLLHAFKYLNLKIYALHCNFNLRGKESNMDEQFVKRFCDTYGIQHTVKKFNTTAYAKEKGISIEMAARDLRYKWFEEIRLKKKMDYIVLGHHADDLAETILINLSRGTGIKGLIGIQPVNGRLLRPLLSWTREEILNYIENNKLGYRTDSTNNSLDYVRNKIRHKVIPVLKEINPSFLNTIQEHSATIKETYQIYQYGIERLIEDIVSKKDGELLIDIEKVMASPAPRTLLYEILKSYGFNPAQVMDILNTHDAIPGKQFEVNEFLLTKGRKYWRLFNLIERESTFGLLADSGEYSWDGLCFKLTEYIRDKNFVIPTDPHTACFDLDKLSYPIIVRHWSTGDWFCPIGMKRSKKKVSDFFIDLKFSAKQKKETILLQSGKDIIWIVGYRMDERYKISISTKRVLKIEFTPTTHK